MVTFQCSEISLTSSESKQDETKHQILSVDNHILAISPSKLIIFGFYSMGSELFFWDTAYRKWNLPRTSLSGRADIFAYNH